MAVKWNLKGLRDLTLKLQDVGKNVAHATKAGSDEIAKKLEGDAKAIFKSKVGKFETGATYGSIEGRSRKVGKGYTITLESKGAYYKGFNYAKVQEFGAGIKANANPHPDRGRIKYTNRTWSFYNEQRNLKFRNFRGQVGKAFLYGAYKKNYKNMARFIKNAYRRNA